jgi:hypothetical protein
MMFLRDVAYALGVAGTVAAVVGGVVWAIVQLAGWA